MDFGFESKKEGWPMACICQPGRGVSEKNAMSNRRQESFPLRSQIDHFGVCFCVQPLLSIKYFSLSHKCSINEEEWSRSGKCQSCSCSHKFNLNERKRTRNKTKHEERRWCTNHNDKNTNLLNLCERKQFITGFLERYYSYINL